MAPRVPRNTQVQTLSGACMAACRPPTGVNRVLPERAHACGTTVATRRHSSGPRTQDAATGDTMMRSAARTQSTSRKQAKTTRRGPTRGKAARAVRTGERPVREEDVTIFLPLVRQVVQQIQAALPAS